MTCVELITCLPEKPLEIFNYWEFQYGIPVSMLLALIVFMIIGAIYVKNRSLAQMSVLTIYSVSVFGSMFVNDNFLEQQYHTIMYIVAIAIASVVVMMVLKLVKE